MTRSAVHTSDAASARASAPRAPIPPPARDSIMRASRVVKSPSMPNQISLSSGIAGHSSETATTSGA